MGWEQRLVRRYPALRSVGSRLPVVGPMERRIEQLAGELAAERARADSVGALAAENHVAIQELTEALSQERAEAAMWSAHQNFAPGHYYSPVPHVGEALARVQGWADRDLQEAGIHLGLEEQWGLLDELAPYLVDHGLPLHREEGRRYWRHNDWFAYSDGVFLAALVRHLQPDRVVEVGSGFSSACMLDTRDAHGGFPHSLTFIDPEPERLRSLLVEADTAHVTVLAQQVQDVDLSVVRSLRTGDILFIDSSHVLKTGSDVAWYLQALLPSVAVGVWIQIHDICYPFEYFPHWIEAGWGWNEAYALQSFLQFNDSFRIALWPTALWAQDSARMEAAFPEYTLNKGGSIWLRRCA